jgi:hypothetical protein
MENDREVWQQRKESKSRGPEYYSKPIGFGIETNPSELRRVADRPSAHSAQTGPSALVMTMKLQPLRRGARGHSIAGRSATSKK